MPTLPPARRGEIRYQTRLLLGDLWKKRQAAGFHTDAVDPLIPIPTDKIIRHCLGIELEEPETIDPIFPGVETAGYADRTRRCIGISQKYRSEIRRFTMAHEIGHWILHPESKVHRDRPLSGGERANGARAIIEQEADCFAAELLMPHKRVDAYFREHFGSPINGESKELQDLVFWLQSGSLLKLDAFAFRQDRRYRALAVARASFSGPGTPFVSLAQKFGVSPTAMAIQLEDFALVV
jgi:hypothetical protein